MVKTKEDLTGRQFGRLTVICQDDDYVCPNGKHAAKWVCECSCEEKKRISVIQSYLKSGVTQSCGCLRKEMIAQWNVQNKKEYNDYDYSHEYGIGYCHNTGTEFYFDWEDFNIIKDYCWSEHINDAGYHILRAYDKDTKSVVTMAGVLGCKGYDHKNRNPLDNRKENLRIATQKENTRNKSKQKNNTSGVTGVGYMKKNNMWRARIAYNDNQIYLGLFENKNDAIKARLKAEKEYFGEFAPQKHLFKIYGI